MATMWKEYHCLKKRGQGSCSPGKGKFSLEAELKAFPSWSQVSFQMVSPPWTQKRKKKSFMAIGFDEWLLPWETSFFSWERTQTIVITKQCGVKPLAVVCSWNLEGLPACSCCSLRGTSFNGAIWILNIFFSFLFHVVVECNGWWREILRLDFDSEINVSRVRLLPAMFPVGV